MESLFKDSDLIYSYSWEDAISDGTFILIPPDLSSQLFKYPVSITRTIYEEYIEGHDVNGRLWDVLWMLKNGKMDGSTCEFKVKLGRSIINLMATCEAKGPNNPEPILNIYLPNER